MPAEPRPLDTADLVVTLARHEVEYLVVGGIAAILHGWPGATADFDALGARTTGNLERLAAALAELQATAEGWDGSPAALSGRSGWSFETRSGRLDLLFVLEPWGVYDDLRPRAASVQAFDVAIPVVGLDDLIALKQALGRPKDLRVAAELEQLRQRGSS